MAVVFYSEEVMNSMLFSNYFVQDVERLTLKINSVRCDADFDECINKLRNLMNTHPFQQIKIFVEKQRQLSTGRLITLKDNIIFDLELLDQEIRRETDDLGVLYCLDCSKEKTHDTELFPSWREAGVRVALTNYLCEQYNPQTGLALLCKETNIKKYVDETLYTVSVVIWEEEHKKKKNFDTFFSNACLIEYKKNIDDPERFKIAAQHICSFLLEIISVARNLHYCPIEKISFTFNSGKSPKNASITIYINDTDPILFEGVRAYNVGCLFSHRYGAPEFDKFQSSGNTTAAKCASLRKDFDEVNQIVAKKWYRYGFVHGAQKLICSESYDHKINPEILHYVKKNNQ